MMILNNISMNIPDKFFDTETRMDYQISSKMKKVWAIQIDLLYQIKRVCQKYNLQYFADSGTLLGAIRHGGYIPWDDDLDIVMKRADYDKLIKLAPKEFNEPYFLQSAHSEIFPRGYARLRNTSSTGITKYDLGKHINCGIFIDIFPLDNVPDNKMIRKRWLKKIRALYAIMKAGCSDKTAEYKDTCHSIEFYAAKIILRIFGYSRVVEIYEKLCTKYNSLNTEKISYVAYSKGKEKHIWDSNCFDDGLLVPFEFSDIFIPKGFDSRLKVEYKDYMKPVRAGNTHGTMILEPEIPYAEFLRDHSREEIEEIFAKMMS